MTADSYDERVRDSFARQGMMITLGARVEATAPGRCSISAPVTPAVTQQHGAGHAALAFALGDSAAGYAALTLMPEGTEVMTSEIKINLLRPARGERLIARGEVVKPGRRLVVVRADVVAVEDGKEALIAILQGTMVPVAPDA
ncbi:MAG: PaaI family thioesterase [Gemmobacter sp.]